MEKPEKNSDIIPDNVSPLRYMMDQAYSLNIKFLYSFEEAKITENAVVIMEGDDGGQIYLVCPIKYIKCNLETLENLLGDLDNIAWKCNKGEGKGLYYEVRKCGEVISGGMGGGKVKSGLWIHNEFIGKGLEDDINQVISGVKSKISC